MRWLILFCAACSAGAPGPSIDVDRAMQHVAVLATNPRAGDTLASWAAAQYITDQLAIFGAPVERFDVGGVELPEITVLGVRRRAAKHVDTRDPDLLVRFGGPGKALLIMAHYDTVPGSFGAADNAAACAILIELARELSAQAPPQPVILAFTANEERGLVGAEALAERRGSEVDFAIALDLIGGSGDLVLNGASDLIGEAEMKWLADAADRAGVVLRAPLAHRVISRWWPQAERSDHGAFTRRGIRAVHFYDRGQDGEWIDLAYHSPADTSERVHRDKLDETARLLRALIARKPPAHDGDGFWLPLATNTVVPRWCVIVLDALLAAGALLGLVALARQRGARARGPGLLVGIACFAAAVGAAIALDSPRWILAPLRYELGGTLVIAGALGVVTSLVARRWPWTGSGRYLAIAIVLPLVLGTFWLAVGAAELAWIWLVPAAFAAAAPRVGPLALVPSLLPAALVLAPPQLREAAWNGFLPAGLPLAAWLALFLAAPLAGAAWALRRRAAGPLRTLVIPLGSGLAAIAGVALLVTAAPPCSPSEFQQFHLACARSLHLP